MCDATRRSFLFIAVSKLFEAQLDFASRAVAAHESEFPAHFQASYILQGS
jgi:hypothetical protein